MLLATVAAAGCGGDDKPAAEKPAASDPAPAAPANSDSVAISMKDIQFSPKQVKAKAGQTVTWTNDESVTHNVTATKGEDFKSKDFGQGGTYSYKLDKAGTIAYVCTIHPGMEGTITVTE